MSILDEIRAAGSVYHHFTPNGNDWDVVNGKVYNYTGAPIPPEVLDTFPSASPQDVQNIQDPHGPGNGEGGSDLSNILTGAGFILGGSGLAGALGASGMTAGQSLGNLYSGVMNPSYASVNSFDSGAMQNILNGGAADAPWGVNPQAAGIDTTGLVGNQSMNGANLFPGTNTGLGTGFSLDPNVALSEPYNLSGNPLLGNIDAFGNAINPATGFGMAGLGAAAGAGALGAGAAGAGAAGAAGAGAAGAAGSGMAASIASALGIPLSAVQALGIGAGALLGSQNGSKQAGTTTTVQDIPDWLRPYATNLLNQGQGIVDANKSPDFSQSDSVLKGIMGGDSIQAPQFNPYSGLTTPQTNNSYIGQTISPVSNPYIGQTATVGSNMHLGDNNPYFESVLTKALNDTQGRVNNQFGNGNAFGNSANQELLTRNLGDQANALRYGEYDKQTALSEADVARRLQAQQTDLARNSQLQQNLGQFNANLAQTDLARNAQLNQNQGQFNASLYANDAGRNAGIWNNDANRNQNAFQFGRGQMLTAAQNAPAYNAAKTNAAFAPLTAQKGLFTSGSQTSSPYFNNPAGGALYGGLLGSQLFNGGKY